MTFGASSNWDDTERVAFVDSYFICLTHASCSTGDNGTRDLRSEKTAGLCLGKELKKQQLSAISPLSQK